MAPTESQSSPAPLSCLEKPLPLDGFQGTPDEIEQQWYDRVYLGSGDRMKQLTWRAVIVGMLLGSILSLTNLYANLKMGWSFGVALTAGIISFALWNAFVRLGISKSPMTILENTCMQSAASSAGYSTGGTLTSAVAALLLLTDVEKIETPMSWFMAGQLVSLGALGYLAYVTFDVPYWMSCIAVVISFFLALVVCRITGEANITPTGAMGKVTQLIFGGIAPGHVTANLMAANITSGASSSSADLLVDLKVGYLLGANPRKQFIAQFSGIFLGTLVSVLAFRSMVPDVDALQAFNAPGARTWAATAEALGMGFSHLHSIKVLSIIAGGILGLILVLVPRYLPAAGKWLPTPIGFGLAWAIQWNDSFLFFAGAVLGWAADRFFKAKSKEYKIPTASGIIAGAALTGMAILMFSIYQAAR